MFCLNSNSLTYVITCIQIVRPLIMFGPIYLYGIPAAFKKLVNFEKILQKPLRDLGKKKFNNKFSKTSVSPFITYIISLSCACTGT